MQELPTFVSNPPPFSLSNLDTNDINKHFPGPHKERPYQEVRAVETWLDRNNLVLDCEQFYELILRWVSKDMHVILVSKNIISLLAAPTMENITKIAGERVPWIGGFVEKIPMPVLYTAYSIGFVLVQDVRVPMA